MIVESSTLTGDGTDWTSVARRVAVTVTAPREVVRRAAFVLSVAGMLEVLRAACWAPAAVVTKAKAAAASVTRAA
ncbi:MAG: hypothetical protein ACYC3L_04020 [Gemmatimonadaceae bacterium]